MAERRMFSKKIIDSDAFLDMPQSSQNLYFHLSMRADDEGFINNPKKIMRIVGAGEDDMRILISKRFLIGFESGVVVIRHWHIHNYIQSDRKKETLYVEEKASLAVSDNGSYTECIQDVYKLDTKCTRRLGKDSIGKDSIGKDSTRKREPKQTFGDYFNVLLSDTEYDKLVADYGLTKTLAAIKYFSEAKEMRGYKYKSDYLAMRKWAFDAVDKTGKPCDDRSWLTGGEK